MDYENKPGFQILSGIVVKLTKKMAEEIISLINERDEKMEEQDEDLPTHLYALREKLENRLNFQKIA